jgi:hypothetical protein
MEFFSSNAVTEKMVPMSSGPLELLVASLHRERRQSLNLSIAPAAKLMWMQAEWT